jgi:F-box and WD-40 domain protein 1/11
MTDRLSIASWLRDDLEKFQLPHPDYPEEGHEGPVYTIQLKNSSLVSGSADKSIRIWNTDTGRLVRPPLMGHEASVLCVQFDARPDQDVIISGSADSTIIVWRFSTGRIMNRLIGHHDKPVLSLSFDDDFLVAGGKDDTLRIWNRREIQKTDDRIAMYTHSELILGDVVPPYSLLATRAHHAAAVNVVQLSKDTIVSGSGDGTINVRDLRTCQITHTFHNKRRGVTGLQFNYRYIISASSDKTVQIYDRLQGNEVSCLTGHSNIVRTVQTIFDLNGEPVSIVTGGYDGNIIFWENSSSSGKWQQCRRLTFAAGSEAKDSESEIDPYAHQSRENNNKVFKLMFDGKRLVCAGSRREIEVWNLRS